MDGYAAAALRQRTHVCMIYAIVLVPWMHACRVLEMHKCTLFLASRGMDASTPSIDVFCSHLQEQKHATDAHTCVGSDFTGNHFADVRSAELGNAAAAAR